MYPQKMVDIEFERSGTSGAARKQCNAINTVRKKVHVLYFTKLFYGVSRVAPDRKVGCFPRLRQALQAA